MSRLSTGAILLIFLFAWAYTEDIHLKPGTYDSISANPGDVIFFSSGVYTLPSDFKLVPSVSYLGNASIIKRSQTWEGTDGVTISGFTFTGTVLSFENNNTNIRIIGNTFYSTSNSSLSTVIDMFSVSGAIISYNIFYGINEQQLAISIAQSSNITIASNKLYATSIEFQIYSTGFEVNLYQTGVSVVHNCFWNVSGQAVLIFIGIPGSSFGVVLSNNTIYNYHPKLPDFTRAFNLQLQDQPFVVQGNYMSPAEASGALCNFCTPIVIQTSTIQKNSTIAGNTIAGNTWSYYVQCFTDDDVVPVENNLFYGNVTPPISDPSCGKLPNTILPRDSVPPPHVCN